MLGAILPRAWDTSLPILDVASDDTNSETTTFLAPGSLVISNAAHQTPPADHERLPLQHYGKTGAPSPISAQSFVCDVCQGIGDINSPRGYIEERAPDEEVPERYLYTYIHHENIGLVIASAKAGCGPCMSIRDSFPHSGKPASDDTDDAGSPTATDSTQPDSTALVARSNQDVMTAEQLVEMARRGVQVDLSDHGSGRILIQFFCDGEFGPRGSKPYRVSPMMLPDIISSNLTSFRSSGDPLDPQLEHRPSKDLLSEAHISLVNRWRHACESEHESCRKTGASQLQLLPSRVLELLDPRDENKGVRLVETHGEMQGIYACLSYCWGTLDTQSGQTTCENLSRQLQGIPFRDLPHTVLDAVHMCFKLGFRFLWVDRLCIVQDNMSDWSHEASKMCEVYSRSALTISIPICEEASQSFLAERRKGFREQSEYSIITYTESNSDLKGSLWMRAFGKTYNGSGPWFLEGYGDFWIDPFNERRRWLQRGWTFQEWMLSPRVLHIESMTLWDCFDGYANELNHRQMTEPAFPRGSGPFEPHLPWDLIVGEYSQRKVTHEKDVMLALSGLAACYAQATGHTYLAGHWLEDMPRSLLWIRSPSQPFQDSPHVRRNAPSWSWVSLPRAVVYDAPISTQCEEERRYIAKASVLSVFCQYNPPDSFSAIGEAWIDLNGPVRPVADLEGFGPQAGDEPWSVCPDQDHTDTFEEMVVQPDVCLLLISFCLWRETIYYDALILQPCGWEDDRPRFRRLGVAQWRCSWNVLQPVEFGSTWERRVVRLV